MLNQSNSWCASKYRIAFRIRLLLFFGIPLIFFLAAAEEADLSGHKVTLTSRRLLGLIEPGSKNCTPPAILEFPSDGLNRSQRQHGFIIIHCVLAIYCFLLLGILCEQYFVPAIEIICERLHMDTDVAGATLMAAASSSPELFVNCIGTFVTEGDLGVGTIVGSAVFNILAVPACCALFAGRLSELDWWSVSRDCMMYMVTVISLIFILLDDKVYWYEALTLVVLYTFYIFAMVNNGCLKSSCCISIKNNENTERSPLLPSDHSSNQIMKREIESKTFNELEERLNRSQRYGSTDSAVWSWPGENSSGLQKSFWIVTWPVRLLLWATIPNCKKHSHLYLLTFSICIIWIGGVSYLVAWIITVVGDTLNIPDSIMGLTIVAAGASLPEAVSSVLVTKQGHGTMGMSNTIGSNIFDILLCLGLPWLIKSVFVPSTPYNHWVMINSNGLSYSAVSLLSTLFTFYFCLLLNKFQLDWKVGIIFAVCYGGFIVIASMIELNMLFPVNLPICTHA